MESLWLQICDIQGRLFKLAWKAGYDSEDFMKQFMRSRVARDLDSEYNECNGREKNIFWKNLRTSVHGL